MKKQVCRLSFHRYGKEKLAGFAGGVKNGIYNNETVFVSPPLTSSELSHLMEDYIAAMNIYNANGKNYKTGYLVAKDKLMAGLDKLAAYVNEIANGNESVITLAGFEATANVSHAAPELGKIITVEVIVSNVGGQVILETPDIRGKGVTGYGLILVSGEPLSVENYDNDIVNIKSGDGQNIIFSLDKGKRKVVNGLDSTLTYYGYMYAVNATSVSPLSDARIVKCI